MRDSEEEVGTSAEVQNILEAESLLEPRTSLSDALGNQAQLRRHEQPQEERRRRCILAANPGHLYPHLDQSCDAISSRPPTLQEEGDSGGT